jgi:hypothetical protein
MRSDVLLLGVDSNWLASHVVSALHWRFVVSVGATVSYSVAESHASSAEHWRSEVVVFALDSN